MFIYINKNSEIINASKTRENTTGQEIEVVDSLVPKDWQSYKYINGEFVKNTDRDDFLQNIQKKEKIAELNKQRDKKLSILTVSISIDGKEITLDADKDSQDNIKTAILALEDSEKTIWLTKDNQQIELTREQLKEALRKVGEKKREIVFSYRAKKDAL